MRPASASWEDDGILELEPLERVLAAILRAHELQEQIHAQQPPPPLPARVDLRVITEIRSALPPFLLGGDPEWTREDPLALPASPEPTPAAMLGGPEGSGPPAPSGRGRSGWGRGLQLSIAYLLIVAAAAALVAAALTSDPGPGSGLCLQAAASPRCSAPAQLQLRPGG